MIDMVQLSQMEDAVNKVRNTTNEILDRMAEEITSSSDNVYILTATRSASNTDITMEHVRWSMKLCKFCNIECGGRRRGNRHYVPDIYSAHSIETGFGTLRSLSILRWLDCPVSATRDRCPICGQRFRWSCSCSEALRAGQSHRVFFQVTLILIFV
jgi:hypothetical protein